MQIIRLNDAMYEYKTVKNTWVLLINNYTHTHSVLSFSHVDEVYTISGKCLWDKNMRAYQEQIKYKLLLVYCPCSFFCAKIRE